MQRKEVKAKKRNEVKDYGKQNKRDRLMYNAVCKDNEGKRVSKRQNKGVYKGQKKLERVIEKVGWTG